MVVRRAAWGRLRGRPWGHSSLVPTESWRTSAETAASNANEKAAASLGALSARLVTTLPRAWPGSRAWGGEVSFGAAAFRGPINAHWGAARHTGDSGIGGYVALPLLEAGVAALRRRGCVVASRGRSCPPRWIDTEFAATGRGCADRRVHRVPQASSGSRVRPPPCPAGANLHT